MKKLISMLLCLTVMLSLIGAVPAMAAKEAGIPMEFITNGDMEKLGKAGAAWEGKGVASTEQAHSGKQSLKMASTSPDTKDTASIWAIEGLVPGETYTYSAWVYVLENGGGEAYVKLGWLDENMRCYAEWAGPSAKNLAPGEWHHLTATVTIPEGVVYVRPMLKNYGVSTVYYDDVSLYGNTTQSTLDKMAEKERQLAEAERVRLFYEKDYLSADLEAYQDTSVPNVFHNPGFEEVEPGGVAATGWSAIGEWGEWCSVTDEEAHSGEKSMKITGVSRYNWIRQTIYSAQGQFVPGQQYVISAWVKYKEITPGKGAFIKIEPDDSPQLESSVFPFEDQEWHEIKWAIDTSIDDTAISVLFRIWGAGEIYVDDVAIHPGYKVGELAELRSEVFFYTENETAEAELWIDNTINPIPVGSTVEFKIKDGENVIAETTLPAKSKTKWEYPVMTLEKEKHPYTIEATYKDADGTVLATTDPWEIYRYPRPKMLAEDGTLMVDGEPFYPYIGYQSPENYLYTAKEIGVNVLRSWESQKTVKYVKPILDAAAKSGYKIPITLYGGESAGYPTVIERTKEFVEAFKDHPAVLCWMIMDEPAAHYGNGVISTYKEILYWCKQAYIAIRNIDDVHPVYMVESRKHIDEPYYHSAKYADVFVIDPYAASNEQQIVPEAPEKAKEAIESVPDYKPVWGLVETYKIYAPGEMHTCDDTRHRFYSFAWEGLKGLGLFGLNYSGNDMYTAPFGLWDDFKQYYESGEYTEMIDHFMAKNSPVFNEYETDSYRYHSWVKDGSVYLVVQEMANSKDGTIAEIDLTSTNGRVKVEGFTGTVVNGSDEKEISSDSNIVTINLKQRQSIMYKLTPNNTINVADLDLAKYDDSAILDWATDAIEFVGLNRIANDIANATFAPEQNITRGDFAYFLVNTLGIRKVGTPNQFVDVDSSKYYADAILAGRSAGVLNGSGNDMYEPEAPISRQDAMAIIARGMTYMSMLGKSDAESRLSVFSDSALIADYAREPIAAMTEEEIVKGNTDGTVNPLGNITRAEAAVIMHRIANK